MSQPDTVAQVTVTQRLVANAAARGPVVALRGGIGPDGAAGTYSYARLGITVQVAAAGLASRGLQPKDVVGVQVPDAVSFVLAIHAIRAVGGIPAPVAPGLSIAEMAGQLAESGARMLITAPPLADRGLAAADRSWIRQVFSFADAAGATPFSDLLGLAIMRPAGGRGHDIALLPFARGEDGRLRPTPVSHIELADRLGRIEERAGLTENDVVLAAPPAGEGLGYSLFLDGALLCGATVVATPAHELAAAAAAGQGTAAIVPGSARVRMPATVRVFAVA
jgi:non-ribosomal peptide synthetase component E (peptide arylation enzyme)